MTQLREIDHDVLLSCMRQWMGDRVVTAGLYFPFPVADLDCHAANGFLASALRGREQCHSLMMIRPTDDPAEVEAQLHQHAFELRIDVDFNDDLPAWRDAVAEYKSPVRDLWLSLRTTRTEVTDDI